MKKKNWKKKKEFEKRSSQEGKGEKLKGKKKTKRKVKIDLKVLRIKQSQETGGMKKKKNVGRVGNVVRN